MIDFSQVTERVGDLTGMVRHESDSDDGADEPAIEFMIEEELYGAMLEPLPANDPQVLPEWYKGLQDNGEGIREKTIRRCMPSMEALTRGWIIRLPADVHIDASQNHFDAEWDIDRQMVSSHSLDQLGGDAFPIDAPVPKWELQWAMRTAPGYSTLVMPTLNRFDPRFQYFAGIIDSDEFVSRLRAPFVWTGGPFTGTIPAGTPIIQVVPFERGSLGAVGTTRSMTAEDELEVQRNYHATDAKTDVYREKMWHPKDGTRNQPTDSSGT